MSVEPYVSDKLRALRRREFPDKYSRVWFAPS